MIYHTYNYDNVNIESLIEKANLIYNNSLLRYNNFNHYIKHMHNNITTNFVEV